MLPPIRLIFRRPTKPIPHSGIDPSAHEEANTRGRKRIVGHRNCTPKRVASRQIFNDKNQRPAWIRQIVNPSVEGGTISTGP